ncbi:MAG TPA: glycosyltransferase [Candidatus Saccharimonadales bacterium]|nr:glycosyltransferase [Candidatus Saccharimonadales bacterium]
MTALFWTLGAGLVLELLVASTSLGWRARKVVALCSVLATAFASGALVSLRPTVFTALLLFLGLYRVLNMVRVGEGRMHEAYLKRAVRRSTVVLAALQLAVFGLWFGWPRLHITGSAVWAVYALLQVVVALGLLYSLRRTLRHTSWPHTIAPMADTELPTVTVAIPARNETADLEACLQSLIASDYPKLEVIVLDDCSQTKRTSEIIRGFAHDGVRFVQGEEPSDTWLPKNQAYFRLANEASGEYILFCGVDVRFGAGTLRQLMAHMAAKKKTMVSILPRRPEGAGPALTQALRYWWELVPPRRLFQRPPVLSTCWAISRKTLEDSGGFRAVARSITPEAYFARQAAKHDAYSFLRANDACGLTSAKPPQEQRETAVRTRYPQLHRRPENVAAVALFELGFLVCPFGLVLGGLFWQVGLAAWALATLASVLLAVTYATLVLATRTGRALTGLVSLPLGMVYDAGLLHYSMWMYEFSTVEWKGRNICIPAMHVIPHLPELPPTTGQHTLA